MTSQNKTEQKFTHIQDEIRKIAQNSERYLGDTTTKREDVLASLDNYEAIKLYADWAGERVGKLVSELLSVGLTVLLTERQAQVIKRDISEEGGIRKLLTAVEVSKILGVSKSKAYQLMQRGEIPTVRLGRSVRVRSQDLEELISQ